MTSSTARANAARRPSVLIASPSIDDRFVGAYVGGLAESIAALSDAGVGVNWAYFSHVPMLSTARAQMVEVFLESGASHLLAVDADQGWRGADVLRLLSHNLPFVGATCARWQGGVFDLGDVEANLDRGLAKVGAIGLGFSMIRRDLVHRMIAAYPERRMQRENLWDFFPITVMNGEEFSEDYNFSNLWRAIGGEVWVDLNIRISHWKLCDIAGPLPIDALRVQLARQGAGGSSAIRTAAA